MISKDYVELELHHQKKKKEEYQNLLKGLPEGTLSSATVNGKNYYYKKERDGKRTYIGDKKHLAVTELQKRRLLETAIRAIDQNIPLMEMYLKHYNVTSLELLNMQMPKAYQFDETEAFAAADFVDGWKWEQDPYEKSSQHPENLRHRTEKGDMVRSKSEVIIANILTARKIPYHYEEILYLPNAVIAPDFKIAVRSENRFRYLEHCGMIGKESYRSQFYWKLKTYLENGMIPWRDVFFTFDDLDGSIDTMFIHNIIEQFFQ